MHAVQEDAGRGTRVCNFDHRHSRLILLRDVRLEDRPAFCAGDDTLEVGEELASVTHSQRKCVLAVEERPELFTNSGVV